MLSYVHGSGSVPLLGETIGAALDRAAARFGDRDALISCHQNLRYTYAELLREVNRAARALLALGVERGDRVGIWSPNAAEWMIAQYAAAKVGAILVNINPAYRLRELEYALNQSGISVLVTARRFRKTDYVEMLTDVDAGTDDAAAGPAPDPERSRRCEHLVYLGSDAAPGGIGVGRASFELGDGVAAADLSAREAQLQFDDPVNIQYTSGTTGSPKGATLSHHNILNNGFFVGEALDYTRRRPHLRAGALLPLLRLRDGQPRRASPTAPRSCFPPKSFDAEATLRAIDAERCTSIYGVPTMFIAQLEHPAFGSLPISIRCAPASWPARPVRSRSCGR